MNVPASPGRSVTVGWPLGPLRTTAPASETAPESGPVMSAKSATKQTSPADQKTITIIDGTSGARHDVVVSGDGQDKGAADAAPAMMAGIDQRLLEKSRYGMIPVVADGLKPFTAYLMSMSKRHCK